jgi:hypothetical protein
MDDHFRQLLDSLPTNRPCSRLEPYGKLIEELLRRGRTYRDIASIIVDNFQVRVSVSTVHDFVRVRLRIKPKSRMTQLLD